MKFLLAVGTWMETANPLIWSGNLGHENLIRAIVPEAEEATFR